MVDGSGHLLLKPNTWVRFNVPTVLRRGRFVVKTFGPPREHPPPHVHVHVGTDGVVIVRLATSDRPVAVRQVWDHVRATDVATAKHIVAEYEGVVRTVWEELHGH